MHQCINAINALYVKRRPVCRFFEKKTKELLDNHVIRKQQNTCYEVARLGKSVGYECTCIIMNFNTSNMNMQCWKVKFSND